MQSNPHQRIDDSRPSDAARDDAAATLNSIGDAVLSTDLAGKITYLNVAAEAMIGWTLAAAAGRPIDEVFKIINGVTRDPARNPMTLSLEFNKIVGLTPNCVLVRRDGHESEIEDSAWPIRDAGGNTTGAVIVFRDVGAALEISRHMSHIAQHDPLTGLPNRLLLHDRLTEAIALSRRRNRNLAVCFLDVDGFKAINDSLGHAAADGVLRSIATRLNGVLRLSDTVSRHGGDEFVIVLSEIERPSDAHLVARKLLEVVRTPHRIDDRDVRVTASVGVAIYPDHGTDAKTLIAGADAAMYDAKRSGTDAYRVCDTGEPTPLGPARSAREWHATGLGAILATVDVPNGVAQNVVTTDRST